MHIRDHFGRGETVYDPWHYVPVLVRNPGALRNGASFKDWVLPAAIERARRKLAGADDGNRQMVDILNAVLTDGLPAVEAACAEAVAHGVHSADVVLNILARQREPAPPANSMTPPDPSTTTMDRQRNRPRIIGRIAQPGNRNGAVATMLYRRAALRR